MQVLQPVVTGGVQTWSVVNTVWALLDTTSGSESVQGQGPPGALSSTVTIPYRAAAIRPRMRLAVVGSTRLLEIDAAVDDQDRHIEWTLTCREVAS
jgi:head-tail adaptor